MALDRDELLTEALIHLNKVRAINGDAVNITGRTSSRITGLLDALSLIIEAIRQPEPVILQQAPANLAELRARLAPRPALDPQVLYEAFCAQTGVPPRAWDELGTMSQRAWTAVAKRAAEMING